MLVLVSAFGLAACGSSAGGAGVLTLTLTPQSVKTFHFAWPDASAETEYRLLEKPDGASPGYSLVATLPADTTSHDLTVFLPGRINASYILQTCTGATCTDSAPVYVSGSLAAAVGYVKASNTGFDDQAGYSVALSADGGTLAVGAPHEDSSATGIDGTGSDSSTDSGAVYVYTRSGTGVWSQQAYVKASNTGSGDHFGWRVALAADGNTLAVGAPLEDSSATGINGSQANEAGADSGAVYVYTRSGTGVWSQQAYVKASNTGFGDRFGSTLALVGNDGSTLTLAVGAPFEDSSATGIDGNQSDEAGSDSGAVYVYTRSSLGLWSQQAYVKASNTGFSDNFGSSVALAADGSTLAVGAPFEDSNATGIDGASADNSSLDSGAAYVYTRSGSSWSQQAYVKATNTGFYDQFGYSVALGADGSTLAVGAPYEDSSATGIDGTGSDSSTDSGAAYVYTRSSLGVWSVQAYVKASNTGFGDRFGSALALGASGSTLAVGAPFEDSSATGIGGNQSDEAGSDSGAAYVYTRSAGVWSQQAYVKAANTGFSDAFGSSLALATDGSTLAVGATGEDSAATGIGGNPVDNSAADSGAVYLY